VSLHAAAATANTALTPADATNTASRDRRFELSSDVVLAMSHVP
jgi:hypothetical protein